MEKPIILLAFANEQDERQAYLRQLPRELNALKLILETAEDNNLCEIDIFPNTTLTQLFDAFRKHQDRIAIFHFSGHATSLELLLESESNSPEKAAHAEGLLPILASRQNLQLVFLNGCYSAQQATTLKNLGVSVVIGTVQAVEDQIATDFSIAFYKGLAAGRSIEQSWKEATHQLIAKKGTKDFSKYYWRGIGRTPDNRFPWEIQYREGAETVKDWNLPEAARNPLAGLPSLGNRYPPPEIPYRFLARYKEEDAAIFFGRGRYIRDLYYRILSSQSSPVILLYGQSGVGKSSLLNAGLIPRLEPQFHIEYHRREKGIGLNGTLKQIFKLPQANPEVSAQQAKNIRNNIAQLENSLATLDGDAETQIKQLIANYQQQLINLENGKQLRAYWDAMAHDKPLIIFIDQVEEVFTRPDEQQPQELENFLTQLQSLFDNPQEYPNGKLIFSYRKEYHSELEAALRSFKIPYEKVFLDKLDALDIAEVVNGLTSTKQLRDKYNLQVEPELASEISNNLLSDKDSPVAPVLQIILTKMWQLQEGNPKPTFAVENYRKLKEEGILLSDFFEQQMSIIRRWEAEIKQNVESSGLALDILNYHTTKWGTAESRNLEDLRQQYQHQEDLLNALIQQFEALYLLTSIEPDRIGLAHDTLAPIVQREMRDSDKPGQRALRILETKMADYRSNPDTTFIEEDDLALVEQGANGMRMWVEKEQELIEKSRQRRAALETERQRNRRFRRATVLVVIFLGIVATGFWIRSEKQRYRVATQLLYEQGRQLLTIDPTIGLAQMWEAHLRLPKDTVMLKGIYEAYERNLFYKVQFQEKNASLNEVAFSMDGSKVATAVGSDDDYIRIYNWNQNVEAQQIGRPNSKTFVLAFTPKGDLLAGSEDRFAYRWTPDGKQIRFETPPELDTGAVRILTHSQDERLLCTIHSLKIVRFWNLQTGAFLQEKLLDTEASSAIFSLDTRSVYIGLKNGSILCININGEKKFQTAATQIPINVMAISRQGLAIGLENGNIQHWQLDADGAITLGETLQGHTSRVNSLQYAIDGQLLLSASSDQTAIVWELRSKQPLYTLRGHKAAVIKASFIKNTSEILTAAEDNTVRHWDFPNPYPMQLLETGESLINVVQYTPDGITLLAACNNGKVLAWKNNALEPSFVFAKHEWPITALAVSKNDKYVATGDESGFVWIWNAENAQPIRAAQLHQNFVTALHFSENGQWLLAGSEDSAAVCWHWNQDQLDTLKLSGSRSAVVGVAFLGKDQALIAVADSLVTIWKNIETVPRKAQQFRTLHDIIALSLHSNQQEFAVLPSEGKASLLNTKGKIKMIPADVGLAWSQQGDSYLTGDFDVCRMFLRNKAGYLMQTFYSKDDCYINALAIAPDGKSVVAGSEGKLYRWLVVRDVLEDYFANKE